MQGYSSSRRILIVDDEPDIVRMLKYNLDKAGYATITAKNGIEALSKAQDIPDLIILDIMLPQLDGWEVARRFKAEKNTNKIPVLFLTAKVSEVEEVIGFELGAVDYVKKPFSLETFLARVRSILRNRDDARESTGKGAKIIRVNGMEINTESFSVKVNGKEVNFAKKEFELLSYLARHPDTVFSRGALMNCVWGEGTKVLGRTVDVHIRKIREKLGESAPCIMTVKGVGYKLTDAQH